ncbi:MAG: ATP-binding protein, partial [Vulcanimicrobiota bacterium]
MQEATPKILLVDNGNLSRKLTRTTLADEKFQILEASDSKTALELVEREAPSLLLLNSNLENGNLMEFSRKLAGLSEIRNFHIIFLVEKQKQELIEKIKKLGIMDFFYKPFSPIELLKKVHNFYSESYEDFIDINGGSVEEIKNQVGNTEFHTPEEIKNLNADQLLLYALDVSRLHNKEIEKAREMKKAIQKLKDSEKMKDMFIALVSHELRTPLSIIKGYLYLLQEVLDSSSLEQDISSFMNPISKAANKLEGLMSELLDFSRMKSGLMTFEKREINLSNFLALILKEFKPEFEKKNIEYVLNIEEDFRPVKADYERIKEAFSHFIRNSINFTQPGGRVMITGKDEGIWVEISFSDTGKGIAESHLDKIFSPFYQSENFLTREVGGMGLGLAIAKHIIEDHGGSINVSSVVGKGTTFTLRLPRSYQDAREIVAELKQTYPRQVEELSRNLKATQEQLLAYAQELNTVYAKEKQRTKQLEETLNALERTYIQTIAALSRTVDLKDAYTTPHTDRVSYYAMEIAKHINPELISQRT